MTKRYIAIVNPRGGLRRGTEALKTIEPMFAAAGAELTAHITTHAGHARDLAHRLELENVEALCIVGGDGTVHEVVNGLLQRDDRPSVPLGLIPAGTGNTLHQHLGCSDAVTAAKIILACHSSPLDVARVTCGEQIVHCVNIVGWGAIADINGTAERLRFLRRLRYSAAACWQILRPKQRRAQLTLDGELIEDRFLFVIACNTKSTGHRMLIAPQAEIDDGQFDLVAFRSQSRRAMLKLFRSMASGDHLEMTGVLHRRVTEFSIFSESRDRLNLDGEIAGSAPFDAKVMPGALHVLTSA